MDLDRRDLLRLLGAGAGLAGLGSLAGCMERPAERILPRVEEAPELHPGVPLEYATSMVVDGLATGLLARTLEARPIKIEGNPDHPGSLGGTSAIHQASILDLYDPQRGREVTEGGAPRARELVLRRLARSSRLPGLWFLLSPDASPLAAAQMARVAERHPSARFVVHAPLGRDAVYGGAALVFGRPLEPQLRFDRARVVVSLDADFLGAMPNAVRWSRDFAARHRPASPSGDPGRLYVAEPTPTPTGTLADHRIALPAGDVLRAAIGLLQALATADPSLAPLGRRLAAVAGLGAAAARLADRAWLGAAARDLVAVRGEGLVLAGPGQPPAVHALCHLANQALGNHGRTVWFTAPVLVPPPRSASLADLVAASRAGEVRTAVVVDTNPVYTAPADLDVATALRAVPDTVHVALCRDETTAVCRTFLPLAHYLEAWGDARAHDGTLSLVQPVIRPLYRGLSPVEALALLAGDEQPSGYQLLRAGRGPFPVDLAGAPAAAADQVWQDDLRRGFAAGTAFPPITADAAWSGDLDRSLAAAASVLASAPAALELHLPPSPAVHDGRFAGNAWLQELPKPTTKLTWDNAALLSPATAARLGVTSGDVVELALAGRKLEVPALVVAGQADRAVSLELGYGRREGSTIALAVGADAYRLRTRAAPSFARGLTVRPVGRRHRLAITQRPGGDPRQVLAPVVTVADQRRAASGHGAAAEADLPTLLPELLRGSPQWGMSIDTTICSGCSACVVACQAENNIPVVGRDGVLRGREMHWLRIDRYDVGSAERPVFVNQPMLCQHCEHAPCEYVCPTYATQHSPDGLNEMAYNRCIGTRFCSNNCPYKVRRFNWFDYTEDAPPVVALQRNPNVTVRARGVMEKCTYCVQRIRGAEIQARMEKRPIRPGEVRTACQQACPTGAIQFGALEHAETAMVRWRSEPRSYSVLGELGTRPRTRYLARVRNPNPELGG